jgi:hypothetical protein
MRLTDWVVYQLYEATDMRNSQFNIRRKYYYNNSASTYNGQQVPYAGPDTLFKIAPNTTKWYDLLANETDAPFGFAMCKDIMLMRLGETYLLRAEAQFKQGKLPEAAISLNVIRARANALL